MNSSECKVVIMIKLQLIQRLLPETLRHLKPLKCNLIRQQNLSQAHQHTIEGHSFSWQTFSVALAEIVHPITLEFNPGQNNTDIMAMEINTNPKAKDVDIPHHHMMQIWTLNFYSNINSISSTGKVNLQKQIATTSPF